MTPPRFIRWVRAIGIDDIGFVGCKIAPAWREVPRVTPMVRSFFGNAGVLFTLETKRGFPQMVLTSRSQGSARERGQQARSCQYEQTMGIVVVLVACSGTFPVVNIRSSKRVPAELVAS